MNNENSYSFRSIHLDNIERQSRAPLFEALRNHRTNRVVAFDVPGHKQGRGLPELTEFLGSDCMKADVNSSKPLDNLIHPVSVIKEAEELAAEAFGAKYAYFMVNGTSSSVQAMIMCVCKRGDKIIMPRNVHRSAINALVVCGAVPVYVNPGVDRRLGIPLGMSVTDVEAAIIANPDAKAVLVNNPTYYGVCSDIKSIAALAHKHGMYLLADEAHGTHFYFGDNMPISAMRAGADFAAVSLHKTGGSLTQSSLMVTSGSVSDGYVRQIINLCQTTSASYLLLSSLDIARKHLALKGRENFAKTVEYAEYCRQELNKLSGYYAFAHELINGDNVYDFDGTKLSVHTRDIGLAGIEVYDLLRDDYGIQIEMGDIGNILAIISWGDRKLEMERLIGSLAEIKRLHGKDPGDMLENEYISPQVSIAPQDAFYAEKESLPLRETSGRISGEFVMCYPPGIPILAPGEIISREIIEYIVYAKEKGCSLTGALDLKTENLQVIV